MEKRQADPPFQRLDRLTDGARRDAELAGGGAEAAAPDDGEKLADAVEKICSGHGTFQGRCRRLAQA